MITRSIAITRPVGRGEDTAELVKRLGWVPFVFHTVELTPRDRREIREQVRSSLREGPFDWTVFMSATGVTLLFENMDSEDGLDKHLYQTNFLAVGPRTRDALDRHGVERVSVPTRYSSIGVDEFFARLNPEKLRIALIRSSSADDSLAKSLINRGAIVTTIEVYDSIIPTDLRTVFEFLEGLSKGQFYAILFTSAVSVSNLFEIARPKLDEAKIIDLLKNSLVGTIGPSTAQELRRRGIESIVPEEYLIEIALKKLIGEPLMPSLKTATC